MPYGARPVCRSASVRFTSNACKLSAKCSSSSRASIKMRAMGVYARILFRPRTENDTHSRKMPPCTTVGRSAKTWQAKRVNIVVCECPLWCNLQSAVMCSANRGHPLQWRPSSVASGLINIVEFGGSVVQNPRCIVPAGCWQSRMPPGFGSCHVVDLTWNSRRTRGD